MSPSESQLRAALHDGEGDSPDANAVISHALRLRYERRMRFTAIAGGAAAAAVVGVGASVLIATGGNGNDGAGGSSADKAGGRVGSLPSGAGRSALSPAGGRTLPHGASSSDAGALSGNDTSEFAAKLRCPAVPDRFLLAGGGGTGQFGSSGPLFTATVTAMKICVYPARTGATARSIVLSNPGAAQFADALEKSPAVRGDAGCPANTDFVGGTIEILGVDGRGRPLEPVVITVQCASSQATNGKAVRYVTNLPDTIVGLLVPAVPKSLSNTAPGSGQSS